jgi:hypothetical protein
MRNELLCRRQLVLARRIDAGDDPSRAATRNM